jgi:hypothetical protein
MNKFLGFGVLVPRVGVIIPNSLFMKRDRKQANKHMR